MPNQSTDDYYNAVAWSQVSKERPRAVLSAFTQIAEMGQQEGDEESGEQ